MIDTTTHTKEKNVRGFTLIETMAAISLLMLALIAPMSLAAESLSAAFYARSQITAFYLAQEGIEIVRSVRDSNIIAAASGQSNPNVFSNIPLSTGPSDTQHLFTVDSLETTSNALYSCQPSGCPPLMTNGAEYGYDDINGVVGPDCPHSGMQWTSTCTNGNDGWAVTTYTRSIKAYEINSDELRITVTVTWQQGSFSTRTFTINEDLYRWVNIGS